MELRHLRTFVAVADTRNISEAARRLRVTQPALSRQIKELEHEVGYPLFVRRPNGLHLTEPGLTLQAHGVKALAAADEALRKAQQSGETDASEVRVGYYSSICIWANILGRAFEKLGRRYPKVTTKLFEQASAQLAADVARGALDAALLGPGAFAPMPGISFESACTVPMVAMMAANHRLAKKRLLTIEDLRGEEILGIVPTAAPGREDELIAACRSAGFSPRLSLEAASLPDLMVGLTKRTSLAIVDAFALVAPLAGVAYVRFKPPGLSADLQVAFGAQLSPAARLYVELMLVEAKRAAANLFRSKTAP